MSNNCLKKTAQRMTTSDFIDASCFLVALAMAANVTRHCRIDIMVALRFPLLAVGAVGMAAFLLNSRFGTGLGYGNNLEAKKAAGVHNADVSKHISETNQIPLAEKKGQTSPVPQLGK
ncbi:hypothetical protein PROFUN_14813 [Planoprotostelium fungivorum]|uniref:Uncharacterized protein n=1 Tax=Planoprotostelium fungivorum TaxID=1890364 RepID=A0A2P6MYC6_9EUKA|nr:hypothetical protein PROFUN_14813 [Planoprotostelium fungivorum]